jgi:hypothetical protein
VQAVGADHDTGFLVDHRPGPGPPPNPRHPVAFHAELLHRDAFAKLDPCGDRAFDEDLVEDDPPRRDPLAHPIHRNGNPLERERAEVKGQLGEGGQFEAITRSSSPQRARQATPGGLIA